MNLLDLLPERMQEMEEVALYQRAFQSVTDEFAAAFEETILQLRVATATEWLTLWEKAYGIVTEVDKPFSFRRSRLVSKMRGSGTTTVQMIQNVAESFSNGQVEVIEVPEESRFDIKFVGTIGLPPNMEDLTAAVEEIKPAHLAYAYVIFYRTWGMLESNTWGSLKTKTWGQVKGGAL